jgi:photosystem II stability/assembly factor-like uncharacterized protein
MKLKITYLLLFSFTLIYGQNKSDSFDYRKAANEGVLSYYEILVKKKAEIKNYDLSLLKNRKKVKQFNRWAYFWKDRVNVSGDFPSSNLGYYNADILNKDGKMAEFRNFSKSNSLESWVNIGPQDLPEANGYPNPPQMGRLNSLLRIKHPTDRNKDVLFVGAPNGGVWKSIDGGSSWSPKLDNVAGIGVTDIKTTADATFANYTTKPIYVSTGDYNGSNIASIGVLKSMDGGETYVTTGLSFNSNEGVFLGQLIVDNENTVLVGTSNEIKITNDGGVTWTDSFSPNLSGNLFGRVVTSGKKAMYTSAYDIAFTTDYTSGNWITVLSNNTDTPSKYAVTLSESGEFYVQGMDGQIKKFNEGTNTFADFGTIPTGYEPQGGFNQTLIIRNNLIISGEVNATSSTNNGNSWYNSLNGYWEGVTSDGNYIHSDHHNMGILDGANEFWSVNDGGLSYIDYGNDPANQKPVITYKSSGVIVTQAYSVAINPAANDEAYVLANQDNDAFSKSNGKWYSVAMGDGIQSAVNYNNPNIRYAANQEGFLAQSNTAFEGQLQGNGENVSVPGASFYFPLEIHKTNPNILFAGGNEVYKIEDNSGLTITNLNSGVGQISDIATHGNTVLVTGENGLKYSLNSGTNWVAVSKPAGTVNSVDFNASVNSILYATVSGYTAGNKVYKSIDSGATYTNISGDLPNIVMKEVMLKQGQTSEYLFLATELGVYTSNNGGVNWKKLGNGLPNVDVRDIEIHYTNDKLVAATFGRGLWEINIANSTLSTTTFSTAENVLNVYPNPSNTDVLNIRLSNGKKYNYLIYNAIGGIVQRGNLSETNAINISELAKNVYILKVYNNEESFSTKFIKGKI